MKFVIVGLGSMGKRRLRNLEALGYSEVCGVEVSQERIRYADQSLGLRVYPDLELAINEESPDLVVICTPPDRHIEAIEICRKMNVGCFVEASVVGGEKLRPLLNTEGSVVIPSATMMFSEGPKLLREILSNSVIGEPLYINYQVGQYLPDWHPWESINDYYVSNRATGGAREIVAFELVWLSKLFGSLTPVSCQKGNLKSRIEADIDSYYHCSFKSDSGICLNLTIEVLARPQALRMLTLVGSEGAIIWDHTTKTVRHFSSASESKTILLHAGTAAPGYVNPEEPYIDELRCAIDQLKFPNKLIFPHNVKADVEILELIVQIDGMAEDVS